MTQHSVQHVKHRIQPAAWQRPARQPFAGDYAVNNKLAALCRFEPVAGTHGPESLAIGPDGLLYSGFDDGRIVVFDTQGKQQRTLCNTGGRPLGLRFHPDGDLLACDTELGLLQISLQGVVTQLTSQAEGLRFCFADDLDVSRDGRYVYFSDASSKWHYGQDQQDLIEHGGHGRLLCYDMATAQTTVLMRNLNFANGVTLGPDDAYVLVIETGHYRIHRYWLEGDKRGTHELFIDNLPGFPDNVRFNGRDRFWVAVPVPRDPAIDWLAPWPFLRRILIHYVNCNLPLPLKRAGIVLSFDLDGRLRDNLQCRGKANHHFITQALEYQGRLYVSSLKETTLAGADLSSLGVV